jgi:hypothetical protein
MSVSARRHLPERPSLEQLRKRARDHLNTLRAADPSVKLAAQQALAREYGLESWPKLAHHVESIQPANRMLQRADPLRLTAERRCSDSWFVVPAAAASACRRMQS